MPLIFLDIDIANPARSEHFRSERFLVDSGAVYSVVQRPVLDGLGIRPHSRRTFTLANGDKIERELGDALFRACASASLAWPGPTPAARI